jgi:hypothetical protein
MKKQNLLSIGLVAALSVLATPAAFAASSGTGNITAYVPSQCEITLVEDVHADFGIGVTEIGTSGNIHVVCNQGHGYSLTTPSTDDAGYLTLNVVSGDTGSMLVRVKEPLSDTFWSNDILVGSQGTGTVQYLPFELDFNPGGALLPTAGSYAGTLTFELTDMTI